VKISPISVISVLFFVTSCLCGELRVKNFIAFLKKWLTPPRTLYITKTGWKFLGLTLIVGFAAINTSNNLLYLVFGLMLSFITASGVLSELMLRKVAITRTFPKHIFACQPVPVVVTLTNRKQYISSFSLLIKDFSQDNTSDNSVYVLKIPARQTVTVTYPMTFTRRGLHRPGKIRLSTQYPFGFFRKSATFVETDDEILVYPVLERLQPSDIPNLSAYVGEFESLRKGNGLEIHGVREYVQGDNHARIHWKSTAKLAKLMTKEFDDDQRKRISVVLDITFPVTPRPATFFQDVERAISLTASYVVHFIKSNCQIQVITPDQRSPFDHGQRHLFALLRMLALLQPANGHSRQNLTKVMQSLHRTDVMKILISVNTMNGYKPANFAKIVEIRSQNIEDRSQKIEVR
jgi:uncharacterized protein (DUF58 family)